jgi:hypothetical protein
MINCIAEQFWYEDSELNQFLIESSDNGTLFQRPRFLMYHTNSKFLNVQPVQYKFYKEEKLIGFIIGVIKKIQDQNCFISPFASSYGGFVLDKLMFKEIDEVIDVLIEELKKTCQVLKIGNTPNFLSRAKNSDYIDYLLMSKGFHTHKSEVIMVHELNDEESLIRRIDRKTFTELKQPLYKNALRLEVINGVDEQSYNLLLESQSRFGTNPTHTYEELMRIEELVNGTIITYKSYFGNTFLSGIIVFRVNKEVLNTFYIFDSNDGRKLKANHFLYYQLLTTAYKMGYKYVDFGASTFGWEPNYHLIAFKEKFASQPYLRKVFEKQM